MDTVIDGALKQLETEAIEGMPDKETSWASFEMILKEKQSKQNKQSYIKLALVVSLALVLLMSTQSEKVIAFKNEVFQWIGKDDQGTIISEVENPAIEPGTYEGLSFEEAQEMTLFHLLKPEFLPSETQQTPEIELVVHDYPILSVRMQFAGNQGEMIYLSQGNSSGNMKRNTFIPDNVDYEEISVGERNILLVQQETAINVQWTENGIHYYLRTFDISKEDVLNIIENLK